MYVDKKTTGAFISTGEQTKMFTLHVMTEGFMYIEGVRRPHRRSYYVKNLSISKEKAIAKAKEYCASKGIPMLSVKAAELQLQEIQRRKAEEVQREIERQVEECQRQIEARVEGIVKEAEDMGIDTMTFGKYQGQTIDSVIANDPEYIKYILDMNNDILPVEYPRNVFQFTITRIYNIVKDGNIELVKPSVSEHVGEIGQKIEIEVTVKNKAFFDSRFGTTTLYIFEDEAGNVYTTYYSGNGWKADREDTGLLRGTIKAHDEYKDVKQTVLTRTKFIMEK